MKQIREVIFVADDGSRHMTAWSALFHEAIVACKAVINCGRSRQRETAAEAIFKLQAFIDLPKSERLDGKLPEDGFE